MKAKVVNKIVREASGVHNYTLVPPLLSHSSYHEKNDIDPDTHPLMKPYREQSNTNPVMCSFGHRPKSASRTFHPGTMKIRLSKGEIAQPAVNGRNGFGLPPSVLLKLLHAPKIHHPGEEYQEEGGDEEGGGGVEGDGTMSLYDPHHLFLSNDQIFNDGQSPNPPGHSHKKKSSMKKLQPLGAGGESLRIGEQSWSTTLPHHNTNTTSTTKKKSKSLKQVSFLRLCLCLSPALSLPPSLCLCLCLSLSLSLSLSLTLLLV
jgi:hypothetical protein